MSPVSVPQSSSSLSLKTKTPTKCPEVKPHTKRSGVVGEIIRLNETVRIFGKVRSRKVEFNYIVDVKGCFEKHENILNSVTKLKQETPFYVPILR